MGKKSKRAPKGQKKTAKKGVSIPHQPVNVLPDLKSLAYFIIPNELFQFTLEEERGSERLLIKNLQLRQQCMFSYNSQFPYKLMYFLFFGDTPLLLPENEMLLTLKSRTYLIDFINQLSMKILGFKALVTFSSNSKVKLNNNLSQVSKENLVTHEREVIHAIFFVLYGENFINSKLRLLNKLLGPLASAIKKCIFNRYNFSLRDILYVDKKNVSYALTILSLSVAESLDVYEKSNGNAVFLVKMADNADSALELLNHNYPDVREYFSNESDVIKNIINELILVIAGKINFKQGLLLPVASQKLERTLHLINQYSKKNDLTKIKRSKTYGVSVLSSQLFNSLSVAEQQTAELFYKVQPQYYHYFRNNSVQNERLLELEDLIQQQIRISDVLNGYTVVLQVVYQQIKMSVEDLARQKNISNVMFYSILKLNIFDNIGKDLLNKIRFMFHADDNIQVQKVIEMQLFILPIVLERHANNVAKLRDKVMEFCCSVGQLAKQTMSDFPVKLNAMNDGYFPSSDFPLRLSCLGIASNDDNVHFYIPNEITQNYCNHINFENAKIVSRKYNDFGWKFIGHIANAKVCFNSEEHLLPICYELKKKNTSDRLLGVYIAGDPPHQNKRLIIAVGFAKGGLHTTGQINRVKETKYRINI